MTSADRNVERTLASDAASPWLKEALRAALARDAVDAANDAEALWQLLHARAVRALHGAPRGARLRLGRVG